jgi:hypothetical protein
LLKKLNFKDHTTLLCLNAPDSFQPVLESVGPETRVLTQKEGARTIDFAIAFVTRQEEVDAHAEVLNPLLEGDAILWFCYPKGTSKKYTCSFNRDNGWEKLGDFGWEGVRQVAIDEDWSALRFRKVAYIKQMTCSTKMALSEEGKAKTKPSGVA